MADGTALFSLISGIGGALIGGAAGVYGPGRIDRRRRRHELELDRLRREADAEVRATAIKAEVRSRIATAITEAVVSLQAWARLLDWSIQDLRAGRDVDAADFDPEANECLHAVMRAVSMLNGDKRRRTPPVFGEGVNFEPVTLVMHQLVLNVRSQIVAPSSEFNGDDIGTRVAEVRDALLDYLILEQEGLVGQPTPRIGVRRRFVDY